MKTRKMISVICILGILVATSMGGGCATQGQTGALAGAGAGALIGGLANMHGSWGATALIGAGVGAGVGYLIGNEKDKKEAQQRQAAGEDELRPLAGTKWEVIEITPKQKETYKSIVAHFGTDGIVVTTKTNMKGKAKSVHEKYRISGSTLIIYKPDYVENAQFTIEGKRLIIDYGNGSVVMQRI